MRAKIRCEVILLAIIGKGTRQEKDSAWRYLRSVSARAEADIVNASRITQNNIVEIISKAKGSDIKTYNTRDIVSKINTALSRLVSDCKVIANRLVIANILSGKVKSIIDSKIEPSELTKRVSLIDSDYTRVDKIVLDITSGIQRGASLSAASAAALINRISLKANMPAPTLETKKQTIASTNKSIGDIGNKKNKDGDAKNRDKEKNAVIVVPRSEQIKQTPISKEFIGVQLATARPMKIYTESLPTSVEIKGIRANPSAFIDKIIHENVMYVNTLRMEYQNEIRRIETARGKDSTVSLIKKGKDAQVREVLAETENDLRRNGLFAFIDKGGKRWTLINYCSMLARTTSAQSTNVGDLYADVEHDLYYIVPHSHSCPLCHKVEGKVYSRSGTSKKYPPLASVLPKIDPSGTDDLSNRYFSIHPNCRHMIIKYDEGRKIGRKPS